MISLSRLITGPGGIRTNDGEGSGKSRQVCAMVELVECYYRTGVWISCNGCVVACTAELFGNVPSFTSKSANNQTCFPRGLCAMNSLLP